MRKSNGVGPLTFDRSLTMPRAVHHRTVDHIAGHSKEIVLVARDVVAVHRVAEGCNQRNSFFFSSSLFFGSGEPARNLVGIGNENDSARLGLAKNKQREKSRFLVAYESACVRDEQRGKVIIQAKTLFFGSVVVFDQSAISLITKIHF